MEMYKRVLEDNLEFLAGRFDPITCNFLTGVSYATYGKKEITTK
jgi:hypothetical protein